MRQPGFVWCSVNGALGFAFRTLLYLLTYFILTRAKYSECRFHSVPRVNEERHRDIQWFGQGSGNARMQLLASGSADFSCGLHRRWCDCISTTQMVKEADAQRPARLSGVGYLRFSRSGLQVKCREHPHPGVSPHRGQRHREQAVPASVNLCCHSYRGESGISVDFPSGGWLKFQPARSRSAQRLEGWRR